MRNHTPVSQGVQHMTPAAALYNPNEGYLHAAQHSGAQYAPYMHPAWDHNQKIGANFTGMGQYQQQSHALVPPANGAPLAGGAPSCIMQAMAAVALPAAPAVEVAQPTDPAGPLSKSGKGAKEKKEGEKKRQPNWTLGDTKWVRL
jgi:hypothetical protein